MLRGPEVNCSGDEGSSVKYGSNDFRAKFNFLLPRLQYPHNSFLCDQKPQNGPLGLAVVANQIPERL